MSLMSKQLQSRKWLIPGIVIVLAGLMALRALPIAQYPAIVPPEVTVSATYPGASAQTIAETVAAPLEQAGVEDVLRGGFGSQVERIAAGALLRFEQVRFEVAEHFAVLTERGQPRSRSVFIAFEIGRRRRQPRLVVRRLALGRLQMTAGGLELPRPIRPRYADAV